MELNGNVTLQGISTYKAGRIDHWISAEKILLAPVTPNISEAVEPQTDFLWTRLKTVIRESIISADKKIMFRDKTVWRHTVFVYNEVLTWET